MKKTNIIIIVMFLLMISLVSAQTLFDSQTDTSGVASTTTGKTRMAEGFTATDNYNLQTLVIKYVKNAYDRSPIEIQVCLWSNFGPPTAHLECSTNGSVWDASDEPNYHFSFDNYPIVLGTDYSIIVRTDTNASLNDGSNYQLDIDGKDTGGDGLWQYDGSWSERLGKQEFDMYFEAWGISGASTPAGLTVEVLTPQNASGIGLDNLTEFNHNIWINGTHNETGTVTCSINDSKFSADQGPNLDMGFNWTFINTSAIPSGIHFFNVSCLKTTTPTRNGSQTVEVRFDYNNPVIAPSPKLAQNQTIIYDDTNLSIIFNMSFTDDIELYSVNVSLENGTIIHQTSNIGDTLYTINITYGLGQHTNNYVEATVCDAHTKNKISDIKYKKEKEGIKFEIEERFLWLEDDWVHIYPKSHSDFTTPQTSKKWDRYVFIFNKKSSPNHAETFVIESNANIDIANGQNYIGHVVIPSIGESGYWVDLDNDEVNEYSIQRISPTKVEVTLYGLKSKVMKFNSIGELNCITEQYSIGNLNPEIVYENLSLVGQNNTFTLNVHHNPDTMGNINATLYYNNTPYYTTPSQGNFTVYVTAPSAVIGNHTDINFNWVVNVSGDNYNLSVLSQNVTDFYIDDCTSFTTPTINFTLLDETTGDKIFGDIDGTFYYTNLGITKSYSVDINTEQNFSICIFPQSATFTGNYTLYYSASGYPQRRYYENSALYDPNPTVVPLYLLSTADGIYVRFQVSDGYGFPISSVTVDMTLSGGAETIEQENTDDSGLATFFVDPDQDYTFTFAKDGYETTSYTLRPTTSEIYNVVMSGIAVPDVPSLSHGIRTSFLPKDTMLNNATTYSFIFNLTSSYWDITDCTLRLRNSTSTLTSSSSSYTSGECNIRIDYNTGNNSYIISEATYELNGTQITTSIQYSIEYTYEGDFSLKNFFDDIGSFTGAGFDSWARMVLVFIVLFAIALGLSKIGISDPIPLLVIITILTWMFSFIGWLTLNVGGIPTVFARKYIIALLVTMLTSAIIAKRVTT